jgi:hypothetical protein
MKEPLGVTCAVVDGKAEVATISPESAFKAAGVSVRDLLTHVNGFSLHMRTPEGEDWMSRSVRGLLPLISAAPFFSAQKRFN